MVRKQLYIEEYHEKALKAKAKELKISEAELVRQALDKLLLEGKREKHGATGKLDKLLNKAQTIAKFYRFPDKETFDRQALYEGDRQDRWG